MNYYEILGIEKDATPEKIKKAYRELSKIHHPDKGGNEEEFKNIQKAYETLKSIEKREMYDTYGEDEKGMAEVITCAVEMFKKAVQEDPSNIFKEIEGIADHMIKQLKNQIKDSEDTLQKQNKHIKRIISKPKNDFIGMALQSEIKATELKITQLNRGVEVFKSALKIIKGYEFSVEEKLGEEEDEGFPGFFSDAIRRQMNANMNRTGWSI